MSKYEEQSHGFKYDVFLSFRGEDTRHNIVGYLLDTFEKRGINVFYDDKKLELGEDISTALFKAIEESNISVIVFSENYASSRWCLNELEKIMECTKRNNKQIAFPIFYHVDPSDVRNQRNSYGKFMDDHKETYGEDSEKVKAWTGALSEVANLKGHHYHIHKGHEIDHVKEIAEKVHANIAPKPLLVGENPVGLDQHVEEVKSLLALEPNDDTVCMLGVTGLGGIGKTELAKALYNKIVHQFEAASFLANVREKSKKINGLEDLQKTLLSEMFQQPETELGSTSKGIYEIKHKLGRKKVLLVLDDVDEMKQLENLAGGSDWFGPGSRIILTTRDKGLLMGTHPIEVKTYEMTELNDQHSLELFCRNAFAKSNPKLGYEVVSSHAVGYAKGLPLALKVIGSNLATRKSLKAWESALKDYERIPRNGIQDVLKVSYDMLEPNAQSVFLDIACFFKGKRIEYVEEILDEFSAASNIEELINKSLLNVDNGYLNMHDLIHDMGREIVRQEAPNNPAKRSRLWLQQDVIDVLSANDSRSDAIQGIILDPLEDTIEVNWDGSAFEKMNRLRILIVRNTTFSSAPKHLPNHLRLLDRKEYPSKTFPPKFYPKEVIILSLFDSQLTMEEPFKQFIYLTVMNFSFNQYITTMPDVSKVEKLRELRLDDCKNLTTVHESIGFLKHLVHLSAPGCTKLENFLQRMFLPSLEVLKLDWCEKLEHFPDIEKEINTPLKIHMMGTSIKKLPNSVGNLIGLVSMDVQYSENLEYLPSSLFKLPNVVSFDFGSCSKLGESFKTFLPQSPSEDSERSTLKIMHFEESGLLDEDIEAILTCFPKLEELIVYKNNLVSLPACIKKSAHLTNLDVSDCKKLKEIPECTNLRILNVHGCMSLTHISELPCTFRKIDARKCFNFSSDTSNMLWDQVKKEGHVLEIVMPGDKVPKWFNYICKDGIPCFWVREEFPNVVLALVFQYADGKERINDHDHVQLHLVINGLLVPQKDYNNFIIEPHHVLVCDLRLLYNDEEWLSIDALLLKHEWNQVQISYEFDYSHVTLSEWGVFGYKQGTDSLEAVNLNKLSDGFTYDVFLSFKGEDMPLDFIAHLRVAFQKRRIDAFYDDENLRIGEDISPALCKAIEESNISVIVLSENYASSRWCLDELAKIMECTKRNNKQIVFPIFYHVDPSDVRHQRKSYGEAIFAHQDRFGKESEKIRGWKAALSEVADFEGHHIHTGHEIDHVKEIAGKVGANIAPKPSFAKYLVGLDQRIEEVKSLLDLKPNDNTLCVLGIIGVGGIGKTELAKALYKKIVHQFKVASFLTKLNRINGRYNLKKQLEKTHKLERKNVLLVLDDVDVNWMYQLDSLTGRSDWFGPGSWIIITTRDKGLLMGTHPIEVKTYEMTELNDQHSLELFCRNAFGKSIPKAGYEAVSSRAVGYAKGHPLALKVMGSNFATRKSLEAWEDALKDYERIPQKGIQGVLKVSYDVLEPYAQSVFLDIAYNFNGKKKEYVEEILNEFSATSNIEEILNEFSAASNIEDLVNKCLLNVDNGYLNMHDLLHDMGREIFSQEVPNNPAKFNPMKVIILSLLDSRQLLMEPSLWNIRQLTIEEPIKQFSRLTVMNFKKNKFITTMPDVSKVENLRELQLDDCENLTTVHESIGFFKHLVHLSASGCTKLENFLQRMFLPSLEVLKLDWCEKLEHFPDIEKEMNTPLKIHMMGTSIKKLPNSVGNLLGLVSMDMQYSENLEYLPSSLFKLPNVVAFDFGGCSKLGESFRRILPHSPSEDNERSTLKKMQFANSGLSDEDVQAIFMCFPKLEELNVSYNYNLVSLPACIKEYNLLKKLNVRGCTSLTHISELPCTIQKVDASECFNFSLETSDKLWDQVKKERYGLEIEMPKTKVPEWFDYICKGGIPCLWVRGKFPNVALASLFLEKGKFHHWVKLHLVINGQLVPHKDYNNFIIEPHHVLVCDLRHLYDDEEWLSIDALLLKHEWNQVQISYEVSYGLPLSEWGVYVYKQGTTDNLEDHVQFMCPS